MQESVYKEQNRYNNNESSSLSLNELRKFIKEKLLAENPYKPFTKEWEWEECCHNNIE